MPKVLNTGTEDRVCSFSQYKPTLADEKHFFLIINFFYYLNSTKYFPEEPLWFKAVITARSSMNWTIFERVNGSWNTLS